MVYLDNITTAQTAYLPKNGSVAAGDLTLSVTSTIDLDTTELSVTDAATSDLYFIVSVTLPEGLPDGEFEYELTDGSSTLSKGLLILEGDGVTTTQYEKEIEYEQYQS